jgi:hypothetical protein
VLKIKHLQLAMAVLGPLLVDSALAQTWTQTSAPELNWHDVAMSADGNKLVAVACCGGPIFISTNSGVTWTPTSAPITNWFSVASSADGTRLAATATGGGPYLSADSGATWTVVTNVTVSYYLSSSASSADGNKLFVGFYDGVHRGGGMAASTDAGASWTNMDLPVISIASSADGTRLLAGTGPTCLGCFSAAFDTSTNSGVTWMATSVTSSFAWNAVAASADGSKLVAVNADGSGLIYTSQDSGATWTTNSALSGNWISVASSADGTKLVAAQGGCCNPGGPVSGGPVYVSTDSGATWMSNNVPAAFAVACSADGSKLVAAVNGGGIWTSQAAPTPVLTIAPSGSNAVISWTVPSMDFVLQQNSDLATTNWTDLPTTPTLNLTNLQNQVVVSSFGSNRWFRLSH